MEKEAVSVSGKNQNKKGSKSIIVLIILAIIVVAAAVLYWMYGSLPSGLLGAVISGKQLNSSTLSSIMLAKINSMPQFQANYTGNMTIGQDPPISAFIYRDHNVTKYSLTADGLYNSSNSYVTITYYVNDTPSYDMVCVNSNDANIMQEIKPSASQGYTGICEYANHTAFAYRVASLLVDPNSLDNINITSYGISVEGYVPCYKIDGTGSIMINSSLIGVQGQNALTSANVKFSSCLSAQYNIPLSFKGRITPKSGKVLTINMQNTGDLTDFVNFQR